MVVLVCKNKEKTIKNEGARVVTSFSPLSPYGSYLLPWKPEFPMMLQSLRKFFPTLKGSLLRSQRSDLAEFGTHPRFYGCPCYLQE